MYMCGLSFNCIIYKNSDLTSYKVTDFEICTHLFYFFPFFPFSCFFLCAVVTFCTDVETEKNAFLKLKTYQLRVHFCIHGNQ